MQKYLYKDLYDLEEKHWWHIAKTSIVLDLIRKYSSQKKKRILDIGCGTGKNLEIFSQVGDSYGVDSSEESIKFCQKRGLKNIFLSSSDSLPFKRNFFDVVTMLDVLEHVDEAKTLLEIKRILKNDGILIINVPAFPFLWSRWDEVLHHKRRYTKTTLKRVLNQTGFKVLKISYMHSFLVVPVFLIRALKSRSREKKYKSDFRIGNPLINLILLALSRFEKSLILNFGLSIGTSLISVSKINV